MKRTLCLVLCLVLCLGLFAACGGSKTETPADNKPADTTSADTTGGKGEAALINTGSGSVAGSAATPPPAEAEYYDELSVFIGDKVAILDPLNPGSTTSQIGILDHMYCDSLVYINIDVEFEPDLATEWTANDDASEWTFKLRDDVKFHNGEPFTADDVLFTFEYATANPGSTVQTALNQVDHVEVKGDYEVTFYLKDPNVDFLYKVGDPCCVMMNREAYESGNEKAGWIGTGPYKVADFIANDSIIFERNDDYFGQKALAKKFVMRYIAEDTARLIMLDNDEVTFCGIGSVYIPQYANDDRFVINSYVMNNCNYVAFNLRKPITGDLNFRLACCYAMDRHEILDIALDGYGQVAETGVVWGNKIKYKDLDIPEWKQDLDKAKEYLAKSCYNGEKIYITAAMAHTIKSAQVVQAQLQAIGIDAEVKQVDGPTLTSLTQYDSNNEDIMCNSAPWSLPDSIRAITTPGNRGNGAGYENQEVIDLVTKAAGTMDGPERQEMYYKIQELMYQDMPYYPTFHMALYTAMQKGAGGAVYFPTNYHDYGGAYRLKNPE